MSDETREILLRQREMRGERPQSVTEQDLTEALAVRAQAARFFYERLVELGFNASDAVAITAGQHF